LPFEVQQDFSNDANFFITMENFVPGKGWTLWMALPEPACREASRAVVLRKKLADCDLCFGLYVIAHELAHAYLRNGGWGEITDREQAADALAASWGFPKPS
jgi:hypothetical protein